MVVLDGVAEPVEVGTGCRGEREAQESNVQTGNDTKEFAIGVQERAATIAGAAWHSALNHDTAGAEVDQLFEVTRNGGGPNEVICVGEPPFGFPELNDDGIPAWLRLDFRPRKYVGKLDMFDVEHREVERPGDVAPTGAF